MIKNCKLLILLQLALIFIAAGCSRESDVVAIINGRKYDIKYFKNFERLKSLKNMDINTRKDRLNFFVDKKVMIEYGINNNYDKNEKILKYLDDYGKRQLLSLVYKKEILDRIASEERLRMVYKKSAYEFNVKNILIGFAGSRTYNAKRSKDEAKKLAEELLDSLKSGEDFTKLAVQYSDSPESKNGGNLGWIKLNSSIKEVFDTAYKLKKGEISEIFESPYGYHIIQLIGKKRTKMGSYENERENLRDRILKSSSGTIRERSTAYLDSLRKRYNVTYFDDKIKILSDKIRTSENDMKRARKRMKPYELLKDVMFKGILASYDNINIDLLWLENKLQESPNIKIPGLGSFNNLKKLLEDFITRDLILKVANQKNFHKLSEYKNELEKYKEQLIYREVLNNEIYSKISPADEDALEYYEKNREKYKTKEQVNVYEIFVKTKSIADNIYQRLMNGEDFKKLAEEYTERRATKKMGGNLGWLTRGQYGNIGNKAFKMKIGEISEPIRYGSGWSIIMVKNRKEPEYRPFNKVKSLVKSDIKKELRENYKKEWLENMKKKFDVKIFFKPLEKAI